MKKLIILSLICAVGIIGCSKKIMPESGINNQSKPANEKEVNATTQQANTNAATQQANTNSSSNSTPTFNNMKPIEQPGALDMGKTVYVTRCTGCHALKTPGDYTTEQMRNILKVEIQKAKLSNKDADEVTAYLLANTKK